MPSEKATGRVLLPDAVLPSRYDLRLVPDLERFVFDGKARITVDVHEATSDVVMHAFELQVSSVKFVPAEGEAMDAVSLVQNLKEKTFTATFAEVLPVGAGFVDVEYAGILNDQMAGFYRSSYTDIHGNKKIMASTQFESLDARRCFPCWDEPARKAVFAVTLVVDPSLTAFSNMPEKSSAFTTVGGKLLREIAFMDSPKMSTYLVAMVIGEFDFVQAQTKHGVLVKVYTPPGRADAGTFALSVATQSLDIYDDFFGVPYPLPKLDMVAIPEFAMGAMENWGLVTYREADLLIDQKTASGNQKQRVCIVVTHELAHQWFGNLVTMAWWDDLWLNEGFASWCENYAADLIYPDYQMWPQFASDTLAAALRLDALKSSHPIQVPIAHAEEVEEVFDAISYCKGASVVRMAHAVLGHEAFCSGLRAYMQKHKYSNTETIDLWNAWAESSGKPVKEMMASWTEQMGFPVVEVKSFAVSGSTAKLSLEQSWFLATGEVPEEKVWSTPIFIGTAASPAGGPPTMMSTRTHEIEVQLSADAGADFVLLNAGMRTPMRVAYTAEMRERLASAVRAGKIPSDNRVGLVMDTYALAKAGKLGIDDALRFLACFRGEKDYIVWDGLSTVLVGLQKLLMGGAPEHVYNGFMAFAGRFVSISWEAAGVGWAASAQDAHTDGLLRGLLMKMMSRFAATPAWLAEASRRFEKYVEDPVGSGAVELPDEYRTPIFQAVLSSGGEQEYEKLLSAYKKLVVSVEQKYVFLSLGFGATEALKRRTMQWAISGEVKLQDFFYLLGSVSASSKHGLDMMWAFFQSEFKPIQAMLQSSSPSLMDAVIQSSTAGFTSEEKAAEIEAFFDAHPRPSNKRTISQVLEEIRANAAFLGRALATDVAKQQFWDELLAALK